MRNFLSVTSVFLLLALGCAPAGETPAPEIDLAAERASLMQADRAWSEGFSTSDNPPDTVVTQVLDDVYLLAPDAPLAQGKEAFRATFAMLEATPGFSLSWTPSAADVGSAADLGYTIGAYEMTMEGPEGMLIRIDGKYMTVWKKRSDGTWMVAADMFNADGPPSPLEE